MGAMKNFHFKKSIFRKLFLNRRENRRFKVKDSIFVVFEPLLNKKKQIIDISMGGLSYVDAGNHWTRSLGLNLLTGNTLHFYDKVSYMAISRSETDDLNDNSNNGNRHAVQFKRLTPSQKAQLKNFIQAHTAGVV